MTVASSTAVATYNGNGSTTVFAYPFKILDESHVLVQLKDAAETYTTKVLTTHYSVSGVGESSGGNITFVTAPASGETVVITRLMPFTQDTNYTANDLFPAEAHEEALDELTMMCQQLKEKLDRCIVLGNDAEGTMSRIFPDPEDFPGKYLRIKSDSSAIEAVNIAATSSTLLDEDDMATNSDTAGATQQSIKAYVDGSIAALDNSWTTVILSADQSTTSATFANITELYFTPAANTLYEIDIQLLMQSSNISNGAQVSMTWPTGYTDGAGWWLAPAIGSTLDGAPAGTDVVSDPTGVLTSNESYLYQGKALLRMGASPSGNFQLKIASEDGTNSATVKRYSILRYKVIA